MDVQEAQSYPARPGVPFLVDVRLLPDEVVIEADAPTLTKDDVKVPLPSDGSQLTAAPAESLRCTCKAAVMRCRSTSS